MEPVVWREGFFTEHESANLRLSISPRKNLNDGDLYHVEIEVKENGYLSLFQVFENGQTTRLGKANQSVKAAQKLTYPDLEIYDGLLAENLTAQRTTRDMLVAVLCEKTQTGFNNLPETTSDQVNEVDGIYYQYGTLLKLSADCSFSSGLLYIRP